MTEVEAIAAVNSTARTFLHTQKRTTTEDEVEDFGHEVWLSSVGAISYFLTNGADTVANHTSVAWVIENTQTGDGEMQVYRSNGTLGAGGAEPETNNISIGTTLANVSNASIWVNSTGAGNNANFPRGIVAARLISDTQYELWMSDTGANVNYRTEVVEWPVTQIELTQNYYRWYVDNDAILPTDPWPEGAVDLGENTAITEIDTPINNGERIRLRMSAQANKSSLPANAKKFKLQFGLQATVCSAIASWIDVGQTASSTIWRAVDASPVAGTSLSGNPPTGGDLVLSVSDIAGTYEENNSSAANPFGVDITEDVEYDWILEHSNATQRENYCFRMVEEDGTVFKQYDNYPTLRTAGFNPFISKWRWYDDELNETPVTALADELVTPIDVETENIIKLRVSVGESSGNDGKDEKFKLQFSTSPTFATVSDVVATSSCTAISEWCYGDGVDLDNATITTAVISDSAACVGAVGVGCGFHNERPDTTIGFTHPASTTVEYEFTIVATSTPDNTLYYFRLFDNTYGEPLTATTTFPTVSTAGASFTFTVDGVDPNVITESITTDATTTPTGIAFGDLSFDTETEAAHRFIIAATSTEGYQVTMFARDEFKNAAGDVFPNVTAANVAPAAWTTGCASVATGCFGYHTSDDSLEGGSTRFLADDTYAAFATSTEEVAFSTASTTVDVIDLIYKIEVHNNQPAGDYSTTINYIATPIF